MTQDESNPFGGERRKPQRDEFVRWAAKIVMFQLLILILLMIGFWQKLDKIYNGNPQSGGRELLCAVAKDDSENDAQTKAVYDRVCKEFLAELGGG